MALKTLALQRQDTGLLQQAVEAYRAAPQERTQVRQPRDWAMSYNGLGWALKLLGERRRNKGWCRKAVPRRRPHGRH